jgi:hypothetical protein
MPRLSYQRIDALPKLAWLARIDADDALVTVLHGASVETRAAFFFEGCWSGRFEDGAFDKVDAVYGSGAVVRGDSVVFVPPADTVDSLFHAHAGNRLVVANSLPLLLAYRDDRLDARFPRYEALLDSIAAGIDKYERRIPTVRGGVSRLLFRNLSVSGTSTAVLDKPLPPPLPSYEAYVGYLEESYERLVANARDPARRQPLAIYSTQSRGYDTTAVNAIAARHGFDKVFTCTRARDKSAFTGFEREAPDDDGTAIGRALGFDCIAIDRLDYQTDRSWDEALYYAGAHSIHDVNLVGLNRHVDRPGILLSGTFGEIWRGPEYYEHARHAVGPDLVRSDLAQHGMGEVRLKVGLAFLPFPFIAGQRREEILNIASTAEMQRWRLGRGYDKPIARRIAEERGVPRQLFGMQKLNSTVSLPRPPVPLEPDLRQRYFEFLVREGLARRWQLRLLPLVHRINQALYYHSPTRYRAVYYACRLLSRLLGRRYVPALLLGRLNGTLHAFCVNEVADRRAATLRGAREPAPEPSGSRTGQAQAR